MELEDAARETIPVGFVTDFTSLQSSRCVDVSFAKISTSWLKHIVCVPSRILHIESRNLFVFVTSADAFDIVCGPGKPSTPL